MRKSRRSAASRKQPQEAQLRTTINPGQLPSQGCFEVRCMHPSSLALDPHYPATTYQRGRHTSAARPSEANRQGPYEEVWHVGSIARRKVFYLPTWPA